MRKAMKTTLVVGVLLSLACPIYIGITLSNRGFPCLGIFSGLFLAIILLTMVYRNLIDWGIRHDVNKEKG